MSDLEVEPFAAADYDAPLWLQSLTYPANTDRLLIDAVFPTAGVLGPTELVAAPRAAGANMSVDVSAGRAVIAGTDMALQGKYLGRLKNTVNVALTAAPGAGLTRIDLIHAHITDATVVGGSTNVMTVETPVAGTAVSSNPTPPAVPNSSIPLAYITVASGTAAVTAGLIADARVVIPRPRIDAAETSVTTDSFGNWGVTLTGRKIITGIAMGAQSTFPLLMVRNNTDMPAGGASILWRAFHLDGSGVANATIGVAYMIWSST